MQIERYYEFGDDKPVGHGHRKTNAKCKPNPINSYNPYISRLTGFKSLYHPHAVRVRTASRRE